MQLFGRIMRAELLRGGGLEGSRNVCRRTLNR